MNECEFPGCTGTARWVIYAAYDPYVGKMKDAPGDPLIARSSSQMAQCCGAHLPRTLGRDAANRGSTLMWVVKPL